MAKRDRRPEMQSWPKRRVQRCSNAFSSPSPVPSALSGRAATTDLSILWRNLPTELKVSILLHNLLSPSGIKSCREYHKCDDGRRLYGRPELLDTYDERVTLDQELVFYCLVFPELASFLRHAYYTQNTFNIRLPMRPPRNSCIRMPPVHARPLIRKLHWEMTLNKWNWERIQRLADGECGFHKLQFITVYVTWPWFIDCCSKQPLGPENRCTWRKVVFKCRGRLNFQADSFREECVGRTLAHEGTDRDALKAWISGMMQFAE